MSDDKALAGRVAVITGASKGLGKAMALALAGAGARVALVARSLQPLDDVAGEIREAGGEAQAFQADVSDEDQVRRLEGEVTGAFGKVHILINNAGMILRKALVESTLAEWRQVLDTNLTSVFLMCRSLVPHMKGRGYGRIINLTSVMSWVALPGRSAYAASKTALLGLTRVLSYQVADRLHDGTVGKSLQDERGGCGRRGVTAAAIQPYRVTATFDLTAHRLIIQRGNYLIRISTPSAEYRLAAFNPQLSQPVVGRYQRAC